MNIKDHHLLEAIHALCVEIEKLPASEQQTKVVLLASALLEPTNKLVLALKDAVSVCRDDDTTVIVTDERLDAWRAALAK